MTLPQSVQLYIKPYCGWCHEAMDWLDQKGILYETLDVTSDPAAMSEMVAKTHQRLAPVIDVDGAILADFDVDQLDRFWKERIPT